MEEMSRHKLKNRQMPRSDAQSADRRFPQDGLRGRRLVDILTHLRKQICEGWDSNPRTPSRTDLKSVGVGRAYLPSLKRSNNYCQLHVISPMPDNGFGRRRDLVTFFSIKS